MPSPTFSSDETVVQVRHLAKAYPLYRNRSDWLKQALLGSFRTFYKPFWALRDLNIEVKRGEAVGILGRNGCGKSTLLQIICGMTKPTKGEVLVRGRVAPVLALGATFDQESTGRANALIAGAVLGLRRKQVLERLDSIAEFAGIGDFMSQPIKHYSSGMKTRLAFAICAHVDADVLIIDEALAVGDSAFQKKCMDWIERFKQKGTLLFVSHGVGDVLRLCSRTVWIDNGTVREEGEPRQIVRNYARAMRSEREDVHRFSAVPP
jgi:lipopolysaccharide transport system ATP-binding protein